MPGKPTLNERNFRRISRINLLLIPPLFLLFAWPYAILCMMLGLPDPILYSGTFFFSIPLTFTILHGHVTIALGPIHRSFYHYWLHEHKWGYGALLPPVFFTTRLRLILLLVSFGLITVGLLV
ncbi:hypothetical protein QLX67_01455 [Balneolaceae bacterium ANBcel3]|nr:hypothetical protein [Balneolaceae bacterium ANBcel3]